MKTTRITSSVAALVSASYVLTPPLHAVDYTWSGQHTGGQWQNADNWVGSQTPTFDANADIFFYATGAGRLSNFISADRTIGSLNFNNNATSNVSIRLATTNTGGTAANLTMGSSTVAPSINVSSGASANIEIGQSDGSIILLNNLTVNHAGTGTLTLSRPITQSGGNRSLTKSGSGTLILRGSSASTFAGGLTVNGGTLNLNYADFNSNNLVNSNNSLTLSNGGNLTVTSFSTGSNTQTFAGTTFSAGRSIITTTPTGTGGAVTLELGAITREAGSVVQFVQGTTNWNNSGYSTNNIVKTTAPGGSGVSFVGPGFFSGTGTGTRYVQIANSGDNAGQFRLAANNTGWTGSNAGSATTLYGVTTNQTVSSSQNMYALQPNSTTANYAATLTGGSVIQLNGMLNINTGTFSILQGTGGGQVQIGAERDLVINTPHTGGITIDAAIIDNTLGASSVTIHQLGTGAITLSGTNTFTGGLYVTRGTLTVGSGGTTGGFTGITSIANRGNITINRSNAFLQATDFNGQAITGTGSFTQAGSGTTTLSAANTYTGTTTVTGGTLLFARTSSLYNGGTGSWTAANINVKSGATLAFNVGGTNEFTTGNVTTLLTNLAASSSATNGMNAGSNLGFDTTNSSGGNFTIADVIANTTGTSGGARGLVKLGTGTLVLTNANTYTGPTTISAGVLQIGNGGTTGSLSNSSAVSIATGAELQFNRNPEPSGSIYQYGGSLSGTGTVRVAENSRVDLIAKQENSGNLAFAVEAGARLAIRTSIAGVDLVRIGELSGSGLVTRGGTDSGTATLEIGGKNTSSTFSGEIQSNNIAVEKVGNGTLTLSGNNTYRNGTTVTSGTLLVNGALSNASNAVSVGANGTLGGTGTIAGATGVTGTLAAGNAAIGKLSFSNNLTMNASSVFAWELNGSSETGRGTNYDAVNVGGTLGGSDGIFRAVLTTGSFADAFWTTNRSWTDIFTNTAETSSLNFATLFNSFQYFEGSDNVTAGINTFGSFSITGSTLTWTAIPEPSTALAGLLLTAGLLRRRRSRCDRGLRPRSCSLFP